MSSPETRLFLATTNEGKILEIRHALEDLPITLSTLREIKDFEVCAEDKPTVLENAIYKGMFYSRYSEAMTLADDTGLEVDALMGRPGVHSARYAGETATYEDNNMKLLQELENIPEARRTARFVCVMALGFRGRLIKSFLGTCEGLILTKPRGIQGFGYDPLFYIPALKKTFAELTAEEKNRISHRGKALERVHDYFQYSLEAG
ncbi:MAG: RdgB/HAM1 family non-canonical purine NTP pyrophosphatase [Acidobacteriia bacterium]|nr:RdgB/HAM1 family non-canonical purine NTP pyrophosphatase [Terriglobia bacterium]